jgi:hypothetical protein
MFGTFGMFANQRALGNDGPAGITDPTLDIGADTQYQWIGEEHAVTLRAAYIWEKKKNNVEIANGADANASDVLNDLSISATYIWDRKISFTASRFTTWGTTDAGIYENSANGSPNSSYWNFDLAYLPFMNGGPNIWPWFNARIGIQYTHFDKFDGTWNNVDNNPGLKAGGNDQIYLYTWLMF